jgi:hypothetical protein
MQVLQRKEKLQDEFTRRVSTSMSKLFAQEKKALKNQKELKREFQARVEKRHLYEQKAKEMNESIQMRRSVEMQQREQDLFERQKRAGERREKQNQERGSSKTFSHTGIDFAASGSKTASFFHQTET